MFGWSLRGQPQITTTELVPLVLGNLSVSPLKGNGHIRVPSPKQYMVDVIGTHLNGPIRIGRPLLGVHPPCSLVHLRHILGKNIGTLKNLITKYFHHPRQIIIQGPQWIINLPAALVNILSHPQHICQLHELHKSNIRRGKKLFFHADLRGLRYFLLRFKGGRKFLVTF